MKRQNEQYQDYIARLFPPTDKIVNGRKNLAKTVTFQVTDDCNLKCKYCYQINKHHNVMQFEVAKKFIDMILDDKDNIKEYVDSLVSPGVVIEFIGGEPFLEIDLIDRITNYFVDQMFIRRHPWATRYRISICSNGVLYFNDKVQKYIKKNLSNLSFSISIDGNKKLHDSCRVFPDGSGSYDIAINGVRHYKDVLHGYMGSKMTLAPQNIQYTAEAVESLIETGYEDIFLNCIYEEGWTYKDASTLYYQLKSLADYLFDRNINDRIYISIFDNKLFKPKSASDNDNWCGGTGDMISVDYKGDIYPCIRYMESSLGKSIKPLVIGNVNDGIMVNSEQHECVECLNNITRRSQSTDECFSCPIAEGCSWCSAYNYQCFGTADKRATFICPMHKARALANVYFWNKINIMSNNHKLFRNNVPDSWALEIINQNELNMLKCLESETSENATEITNEMKCNNE
jgi:radical SAM peptide maturase (CXXX-repeat target family)